MHGKLKNPNISSLGKVKSDTKIESQNANESDPDMNTQEKDIKAVRREIV